jgi:hypothetical protein
VVTPGIGEVLRSTLTGKVYEVRRILNQTVILQSLNGLNQISTPKENLNLFYEKVPKV